MVPAENKIVGFFVFWYPAAYFSLWIKRPLCVYHDVLRLKFHNPYQRGPHHRICIPHDHRIQAFKEY